MLPMLFDKLRKLFKPEAPTISDEQASKEASIPKDTPPPNLKQSEADPVAPKIPAAQAAIPIQPSTPVESKDQKEAQVYLSRVKDKISKLAEEFASGIINREQFQELYDHYQREIRTIETWIDLAPQSDAWMKARTEGESIVIRKQHLARILGYAIYKNDSGMPIATIGNFEIDAALVVPMLSSYRSATREIFGAGMRSSQIEDGKWLCFVPGDQTTLMGLFSTEPATKQLQSLNEMHQLFEQANCHLLQNAVIDPNTLVLPHQSFVGHKR